MSHPSRRRFLSQATAAGIAGSFALSGISAEPAAPAKIPLLKPTFEQVVCRWSAQHPRHDHQLIFPLSEGRLVFVWSEYYTADPKLLARKSPADAGGFGDEMP